MPFDVHVYFYTRLIIIINMFFINYDIFLIFLIILIEIKFDMYYYICSNLLIKILNNLIIVVFLI